VSPGSTPSPVRSILKPVLEEHPKLSAHCFCTEPGCALTNTRRLLEGAASYPDDGGIAHLSYEYRLCTRCDMGFVHPVPSESVLERFYTGDYTYYQAAGESPGEEAGSFKYALARLRHRHLTQPGWRSRAGSLAAALAEVLTRKTVTFSLGVPLTLPRDARLLDYGYGTGAWLLSLRLLGYSHLVGYDIAANRERGRELAAQGIEIIPPGELARQAADSLDCVRLEHVFEHLVDPLAVLRDLHRLLRPGGLLVMTFPSIYPWLRMEDLATSPYLDHLQLPIHVAHHSVASSTRLVQAAGFVGIRARITRRERFITLLARKPDGRRETGA
jgi:SAM-dependent methyltransferase